MDSVRSMYRTSTIRYMDEFNSTSMSNTKEEEEHDYKIVWEFEVNDDTRHWDDISHYQEEPTPYKELNRKLDSNVKCKL